MFLTYVGNSTAGHPSTKLASQTGLNNFGLDATLFLGFYHSREQTEVVNKDTVLAG